jgi:hypothetical protein
VLYVLFVEPGRVTRVFTGWNDRRRGIVNWDD